MATTLENEIGVRLWKEVGKWPWSNFYFLSNFWSVALLILVSCEDTLEYTWSKGKFTQHYSREMRKWLTSKYLSKGTFSKQTRCYDAERWKSKFIEKRMLWWNWQNLCSVDFISIRNCVNSKWKKEKIMLWQNLNKCLKMTMYISISGELFRMWLINTKKLFLIFLLIPNQDSSSNTTISHTSRHFPQLHKGPSGLLS